MARIQIVDADPGWPRQFEKEALRLRESLGSAALRIDHVGSTAVPGLAAKPVIDIQVSVRSLDPLSEWASLLSPLGFHHLPSPDDGSYPFFHRPAIWPHDTHLHLCGENSPEERWNLAFRDYLRAHPQVRDAYEVEKRRLAALHDADDPAAREAYADAKSGFIDEVVRRALNEGYGR